MKRLATLILLLIGVITLVACGTVVKRDPTLSDVIKELSNIYQNDDSSSSVTNNLLLKTSTNILDDVIIKWESNNVDVITNEGMVTIPDFEDVIVRLTLTMERDDELLQKIFTLTVKGLGIIPNDEFFNLTLNGEGLTASKTSNILADEEVTIFITIPEGKEVEQLLINNTNVTKQIKDNKYYFKVTEHTKIDLILTNIIYNIELNGTGLNASATSGIIYNTEVTLEVLVPDGFLLETLLVDDIDKTLKLKDNKLLLVITKDLVVTVTYVEETYDITIIGEHISASSQTNIKLDTKVTLTVSTPNGMVLDKLLVNDVDVMSGVKDNEYVLTINSNTTIEAIFTEEVVDETYTITLKDSSLAASKTNDLLLNSEVIITINIPLGMILDKLLVNDNDLIADVINNTYTLIVKGNTTIEAIFTEEVVDETYIVTLKGNNLLANKLDDLLLDSEVIITINIPLGMILDKFLVNDNDLIADVINNTYTLIVKDNTTIEAIFTEELVDETYTITLKDSSLTASKTNDLLLNSEVIITINIPLGMILDGLLVNGYDMLLEVIDNKYLLTVTGNMEVSVSYVEEVIIETYIVTLIGTYVTASETTDILIDTTITLTFNVPTGYVVDKLLINDIDRKAFILDKTYKFILTGNTVVEFVVIEDVPVVEEVTINFVTNNTTTVANQIIEQGSLIAKPDVTYDKHLLDGWYVNADFTGSKWDFSNIATSNMTLYAKWTETYAIELINNEDTITLDKIGPYLRGQEVLVTITIPTNMEIDKFMINDVEISLTSNSYSFTITSDIAISITFRDIVITTHAVTFESIDGTLYNTVIVNDSDIVVLPSNPTKGDYKFSGWYIDIDLSTKFIETSLITKDLTLYAKFVLEEVTLPSYTETFEDTNLNTNYISTTFNGIANTEWNLVNGRNQESFPINGNGVMLRGASYDSSLTVTLNNGLNAFSFDYRKAHTATTNRDYRILVTHSGGTIDYVLPGFGTNSANDEDIYTFDEAINLKLLGLVTVKIYANSNAQAVFDNFSWTEGSNEDLESFEVTFVTNGGTTFDSINVYAGYSINFSDYPSKLDHSFAGWFTDMTLHNQFIEGTTKITKDTILYAKWIESFVSNIQMVGSNIHWNEVAGATYTITVLGISENVTINQFDISKHKESLKATGVKITPVVGGIELDSDILYVTYNTSTKNYISAQEGDTSNLSGYYATAKNLEGLELITELQRIISNYSKTASYGEVRYILEKSDIHPKFPEQVSVIYNNVVFNGNAIMHLKTWDGATGGYQREHVWPSSKLGVGRPNNSTRSQASDPHNLRAINGPVNAHRGNRFFDLPSDYNNELGHHSGQGYYPGDVDRGDVARIMMFMALRYEGLISLTNDENLLTGGTSYDSSSAYSGKLERFDSWHFEDGVDNFETIRNDVIYQEQGNRNPFIDHPELFKPVFDYFTDIDNTR